MQTSLWSVTRGSEAVAVSRARVFVCSKTCPLSLPWVSPKEQNPGV